MSTSTHRQPAGGDLTLAVLLMADRCSSADVARSAAFPHGPREHLAALNRTCRRRRKAFERLVFALAEQATR